MAHYCGNSRCYAGGEVPCPHSSRMSSPTFYGYVLLSAIALKNSDVSNESFIRRPDLGGLLQ
eukprot:3432420-Prorocentrum_lima.AAC.1